MITPTFLIGLVATLILGRTVEVSQSKPIEPSIRSTHVRLLVVDFDREFRFFRDILGFKSTFGKEGENYADFDCNGFSIALFKRTLMSQALGVQDPDSAVHGTGPCALIFGVTDVDAMTAHLKNAGVHFVTQPHDMADWGIRVAHFRDPEGNLIEINHSLRPKSTTEK